MSKEMLMLLMARKGITVSKDLAKKLVTAFNKYYPKQEVFIK